VIVNARKFMVAFVVLAALVVGYLLYAQLGGTPPVELDLPAPLPEPIAQQGDDTGDGSIGTVAGIGIGTLKQPRFFHTNENQQVDREMGFEELLPGKEGDQWEITNPFMKLFLPEFRCDVTADRGTFQLETAFGKPMPNDAVFQGNVVSSRATWSFTSCRPSPTIPWSASFTSMTWRSWRTNRCSPPTGR